MAHTVQFILKGEDQISPVLEKAAGGFETLKQTIDSVSTGLAPMNEQLDRLDERLDTIGSAWDRQQQMWKRQQQSLGDTRAEIGSFSEELDMHLDRAGTSVEEFAVVTERETGRQYAVWGDLGSSVSQIFSDVFQGLIDGTADAGGVLTDLFSEVLNDLSSMAENTQIRVPVTLSANSLTSGFVSSGSGGNSVSGETSWLDQLTGSLSWALPALGFTTLAIPLLDKLFEDRPQPRFDTRAYAPGGFQQFIGSSPGDLLSVLGMNSDAEDSAGSGAAEIQHYYETAVGGFQNTLREIYQGLPEAVREAWDNVSGEDFEAIRESTRKTVSLAVSGHLKLWLSAVDFTLTDELIKATSSEFAASSGFDRDAAQSIAGVWSEKLEDWFTPLLEAATAETLDAVFAQYQEYLSKFFSGISSIMGYAGADVLSDLEGFRVADSFAEQAARVDEQINFLTESLSRLEGLEYANALSGIADLLTQRYEMELSYLAQLKDTQEQLLADLHDQASGFAWDLMDQQERFEYARGRREEAWTDIFSADTPDAAASAARDYMEWTDTLWNQAPADWRSENLGAFEQDAAAVSQYINEVFGLAVEEVVNGHNQTADAITATVAGLENVNELLPGLSEGLQQANYAAGEFAEAVRAAANAIVCAVQDVRYESEVGV